MDLEYENIISGQRDLFGVHRHLVMLPLPTRFPDVIGTFGFLIESLYFASNAMVFGSTVSASSWEPFQVAIAAIATSYYFNKKLVQKYQHLLDMIKWERAVYPIPQLVRATACSKNKGIINEDGTR